MSKTIWLIRHAENSKDEATGLALTEQGQISTRLLATKIASVDKAIPTIIFTSPVLRGTMTGQILRDVFQDAAKQAFHIPIPYLAARNDEDLVNTLGMIFSIDEQAKANGLPEPQSIIFIGHKQNDALQLLAASFDPEGYATDYKIAEEDRLRPEDLNGLTELSESDIEILYPGVSRPMKQYTYLEATMFRFLPEKWSNFRPGCARHQQTLTL